MKAFHDLGFEGIDNELLNPYHTDGMFGNSELGLVSEDELRNYVREQAGNPNITDKQIDDAYYEFIGEIVNTTIKGVVSEQVYGVKPESATVTFNGQQI